MFASRTKWVLVAIENLKNQRPFGGCCLLNLVNFKEDSLGFQNTTLGSVGWSTNSPRGTAQGCCCSTENQRRRGRLLMSVYSCISSKFHEKSKVHGCSYSIGSIFIIFRGLWELRLRKFKGKRTRKIN